MTADIYPPYCGECGVSHDPVCEGPQLRLVTSTTYIPDGLAILANCIMWHRWAVTELLAALAPDINTRPGKKPVHNGRVTKKGRR